MSENTRFSTRRRLLLGLGASATGLLAAPLPAIAKTRERQPVVVVTSYNDEVFSRFEAAFEKDRKSVV